VKIDWSNERCYVCGGEFQPSSIQVTNERTGKTTTRKVMACVRCGDTAFSPEQYTAKKFKEVGQEMRRLLSSHSPECPGCVNCGRGMSDR
jgi:hypothetical protein